MSPDDQPTRYEEALQAGRSWAARQIEFADGIDVAADLEDALSGAAAAYVALQTGQLPSLFFADFAQHQLELDMNTGFQIGVSEVLEESRQSRGAAGTLPGQTHEGGPEGAEDQEAGPSMVFLAQIGVGKPSRSECISRAVEVLHDVRTRLEAGETEGSIYDEEGGNEIASFGLALEGQGA